MTLQARCLLACALLTAVALRAQTTDTPAANPPPADAPPPSSVPSGNPAPYAPGGAYGGYGGYRSPGYGSGTTAMAAISVPYAFNWNALGISAEAGALWMGQHFFGGEVSYYGGDRRRYDVYNGNAFVGSFHSEQEITTVDLAYRYLAPLQRYGGYAPISFYVGGSAGVAFVNYSNNGGAFGFHNDDNGDFTGEFLAGFQFGAGPGTSVRLGYRYIFVDDAWRFDRQVDLDSSALEASLAFRF